jgi:hypothetical protein
MRLGIEFRTLFYMHRNFNQDLIRTVLERNVSFLLIDIPMVHISLTMSFLSSHGHSRQANLYYSVL